jgi:bromodomain-containing factor 1
LTEDPSSAEFGASIVTNADLPLSSNSPENHLQTESSPNPATSEPESAINNPVEAAVDDSTATSSVLPVIESQESDIRDTALPLYSVSDTVSDLQIVQETTSLELKDTSEPFAKSEPFEQDPAVETTTFTFDESLSQPSPAVVADQQSVQQSPDLDTVATMQSDLEHTQSAPQAEDVEMAEAPAQTADIPASIKIAREREDDNEVEPSAKRAKTEDEVKASAEVEAQAAPLNGEQESARTETAALTPYEAKELGKIVRNSLRTKDGKNFRDPVTKLWPTIAESYSAKVTNPIDLATMEVKIREGKYSTMNDFKADLILLYDNCALFNGPEHEVTKAAKTVGDSIFAKISSIPPEPVAVPKAAKIKGRKSTPTAETSTRATTARRPPRAAATNAAAPPAQTFALDPTTSTPLIRRDSKQDLGGRPKREIHPPKNKDLVYSVRPKSKKYATELKFCEDVLVEIKKSKYYHFTSAFLTPVDPVALNIPNYFTVIKAPMDISTVSKKLSAGDYTRAKEFENDMRQIGWNCNKFNPVGNPVREMGRQYDELFNSLWAKKDKYISDHTPAAASASDSADEDDESEEEEEVEVLANPVNSAATLRLIEEQNKLITLMTNKNSDPAIVTMQQDMVDFLTKKVDEEKLRAAPPKKASKKTKVPKAPKRVAPVKKAASGGGTKKGGKNQRYLGTLEKEIISAGLGELPDHISADVLTWIKNEQPGIDVSLPEISNVPYNLANIVAGG